ncbi:Response regulator protein TmoT [Paraburkholderia nemoris]|uniref:response regulator transcription factor n=1 Tax=Paraburkholderia nemoris TaxID=2793076 RepID=UPI00190C0D83|nr:MULTISPECIES: response regulator [Paraburkholderia]MBK3786277.1 response regulator transcription factor [Paraburkholderia aspalathi]CAE6850342.1 Response regulator protein TmoT [Paraburkholderia nemoris]
MTDSDSLVFVVDDDDSVRRALARLIQSAGYRVETFDSARAFLDRMRADTCPACLVLDIQLPDLSGLELQRELNEALPIIFITGYGDIPMTVGAMKAGATDFLPKPVRDTDLLHAIGQAFERLEKTYAVHRELDAIRVRLGRLTPREREVMALVVTGRLNKQVAGDLGTVEKTIKAHRARVMSKMEVTSLAELVRVADKVGLGGAAETHASH